MNSSSNIKIERFTEGGIPSSTFSMSGSTSSRLGGGTIVFRLERSGVGSGESATFALLLVSKLKCVQIMYGGGDNC